LVPGPHLFNGKGRGNWAAGAAWFLLPSCFNDQCVQGICVGQGCRRAQLLAPDDEGQVTRELFTGVLIQIEDQVVGPASLAEPYLFPDGYRLKMPAGRLRNLSFRHQGDSSVSEDDSHSCTTFTCRRAMVRATGNHRSRRKGIRPTKGTKTARIHRVRPMNVIVDLVLERLESNRYCHPPPEGTGVMFLKTRTLTDSRCFDFWWTT